MWISKFNFLSLVIPRYLTDSFIGIMDPLKTKCMLGGRLVVFRGNTKTEVFFRINRYFIGFGPFVDIYYFSVYAILQ